MFFGIVSLFPEIVKSVTAQGVVGRALKAELIELQTWNPRDYTHDVHRTVDDRPYGGGPGMLMKVSPVVAALEAAKAVVADRVVAGRVKNKADRTKERPKCIYLSPQGRPLKQSLLHEAASWSAMILLCGRYEGIDERVIEHEIDDEWSLGDFVLSGGEIAAAAVIDGVSRLVPGVLGHRESAKFDSFENGLLDCPHYTRPEVYQEMAVPKVLLSGNHEKIRRWRLEESIRRTLERRPDLINEKNLSSEEMKILRRFKQKH